MTKDRFVEQATKLEAQLNGPSDVVGEVLLEPEITPGGTPRWAGKDTVWVQVGPDPVEAVLSVTVTPVRGNQWPN